MLRYLKKRLQGERVHMTLVDPENQSPQEASEMARTMEDMGTDAIMVGGSTGVTQQSLDDTVRGIKKVTKVPVILFPAGAHTISRYADAIYFMSMLNSKSTRLLVGEQVEAAKKVKDIGLETISMGYVIVEPGMKVGEVGRADPIPRDEPQLAVKYGLAAEYLGMDLFYLEAGSGAPAPVPTEIVRAVKEEISIPLVVGGGISSRGRAAQLIEAGADIVVTGTAVERTRDLASLRGILDAIKRGNQ
ncbi:MAG: geranylgeranylglyceryl/heptaprenylglyceryl phosphate synthase [Thermoplasmata archaeon]